MHPKHREHSVYKGQCVCVVEIINREDCRERSEMMKMGYIERIQRISNARRDSLSYALRSSMMLPVLFAKTMPVAEAMFMTA